MSKFVFKLYVTGRSSRSERAIATLRRICEEHLADRYEMAVIDVLEWPQLAEEDRILATPTLIKQLPLPAMRLIGDLSDTRRVMKELDLAAGPWSQEAVHE